MYLMNLHRKYSKKNYITVENRVKKMRFSTVMYLYILYNMFNMRILKQFCKHILTKNLAPFFEIITVENRVKKMRFSTVIFSEFFEGRQTVSVG